MWLVLDVTNSQVFTSRFWVKLILSTQSNWWKSIRAMENLNPCVYYIYSDLLEYWHQQCLSPLIYSSLCVWRALRFRSWQRYSTSTFARWPEQTDQHVQPTHTRPNARTNARTHAHTHTPVISYTVLSLSVITPPQTVPAVLGQTAWK